MSIKKIKPGRGISGEIQVTPDKSITHRALMLASVAKGKTIIRDPSYGEDCKSTVSCLQKLGVSVDVRDSFIEIKGVGRQGFRMPTSTLNAGNSGTTLRMLAGLLAGQPLQATIDGDESLRRRPLNRVIEPLCAMGAEITGTPYANNEQVCPLTVAGRKNITAIHWDLPVASAQVKSAILFAGLNAEGRTSLKEPHQSRDHTERMLKAFGCPIEKCFATKVISLDGPKQPGSTEITVCGDFSSAAFFVVLALILPDSSIVLKHVGVNPTRIGLIPVLTRMGGSIRIVNEHQWNNEPVGDIEVCSSDLTATTVKEEEIPALIDEIPILAVAAAHAEGTTVITGARELQYKESNRLKAITEGLQKMGIPVTAGEDTLEVTGEEYFQGASVESYQDHRIAMALAVAGICAYPETKINSPECVDISFPGFWDLLEKHVIR